LPGGVARGVSASFHPVAQIEQNADREMNLLLPSPVGIFLLDARRLGRFLAALGSLRRCFETLNKRLIQLLEGPPLKPDFLGKRGHCSPQRIEVTAAAVGLLAFQRRKQVSAFKRSEQPRGQSLRQRLVGDCTVKQRLEAANNPFPLFR
jgi:hypothetical protein